MWIYKLNAQWAIVFFYLITILQLLQGQLTSQYISIVYCWYNTILFACITYIIVLKHA